MLPITEARIFNINDLIGWHEKGQFYPAPAMSAQRKRRLPYTQWNTKQYVGGRGNFGGLL